MPTNPDDHVVYDPRTVYFDEVVSKIVAQPQADGESGLITEDALKVGDKVHAGLANAGGAGYVGTITKIEDGQVWLELPASAYDKFGPRTIIAPLKNVQKEERTFTDLRIDESAFLDPKDAEARNKLGAERIRLYNLGQKGSAEYKKVEQALYKILVKAENEWRRQVGREAYAAPPGFETEFGLRAESTDLTEAKANWKEIDFMHETRELLLNSAYGNPPCWCRATYSTGNKHKDWCKTLQQGFKGLEAAIKASV